MAVDNQGRRVRRHSGEGQELISFVWLLVCMAFILGSMWLFTLPYSWWFFVGIFVYGASLFVPTLLMTRATRSTYAGGRSILLDIPRSTEVEALDPKAVRQ